MSLVLPSGGALGLDAKVAELYVAQMDLICAPDGSKREDDALKKRDAILGSMTAKDCSHAALVATAVTRLVTRGAA